MASLTDIRTGLAANLRAIADLQVSAYMLSQPTAPSAHVFPGGAAGDIEYHQAMRDGVESWPMTVQVFVALSADIGSQVNLDAYIASSGARSVKAAIEADTTLGGAAQDLIVVSCSGYRQFVFEGRPPLLGAEWHVRIYAN